MTGPLIHRRVVTGVDADGRSTVVSDGPAPITMESTAFSLAETWRVGSVPATLDQAETVIGAAALEPTADQVLMRFCHFAPESADIDWHGSLASIGGGEALDTTAVRPGVHRTDTIDHIVVVSGEIYLVLDDSEVLLRAGDTVVQRGVAHAWSNRSDADCIVFTVQVALRR